MQPIILDGDGLARNIRAGLAAEILRMRRSGITPSLATVLVGNDPASEAYIARKHADCHELGIASREVRLPGAVSGKELAHHIDRMNADPSVHGFLVQLPLPPHLDDSRFIARVDPSKDIDGLHPENLGKLLGGEPSILPCTPAGVLALLQHHDVPLAGRNVVIIGRGALVGRPLAMLLSIKGVDATVTLAHSRSTDLDQITVRADVVISATGVKDLVREHMVRPGAAVVGVGIHRSESGEILSDIAPCVQRRAAWLTPPHGSVGALTRAMLLKNLLKLVAMRSA